jgi:hypothetical protein
VSSRLIEPPVGKPKVLAKFLYPLKHVLEGLFVVLPWFCIVEVAIYLVLAVGAYIVPNKINYSTT